jgi:hypothetical protein
MDELGDRASTPSPAHIAELAREVSAWTRRHRRGSPGTGRVQVVGSSNGCSLFAVRLGSNTIKCYECLTPRRARLVYQLCEALRGQGVEVPECFGVRGRLVISEWVDGASMGTVPQDEKIELIAAYQARLHAAAVPGFGGSDAWPWKRDCWRDWRTGCDARVRAAPPGAFFTRT